MELIWYLIVWVMLAGYVLFDGLDIGSGILHLFIGKTDRERNQIAYSVGPIWDGNEVWLLSAGGVIFLAFPKVLATALSGFYLPIMVVMWLLILRAIGIELRHHMHDPMIQRACDVSFGVSSILLALFFGAALGNVVRGVPINEAGVFFSPLWTHFKPVGDVGILDWYTTLVGITAVVVLAYHGALWLFLKTDAAVQSRAQKAGFVLGPVVCVSMLIVSLLTFRVQPTTLDNIRAFPIGIVLPLLAIGCFGFSYLKLKQGKGLPAMLGSFGFILFQLLSVVLGLWPNLLPAQDPSRSLTYINTASAEYALKVGLWWWIPAMILVGVYFTFLYTRMAKKVAIADVE